MGTARYARGMAAALGGLVLAGCGGDGSGERDGSAPGDAGAGARGPAAIPAETATTAPAAGEPAAWFENTARRVGVDFVHRSGRQGRPYFPEIMGGGVALLDMDGDEDLDLYLVQSGSVREPGGEMGRNALYRNEGNGAYVNATDGSGADDPGYGMGVAVGDYDNDGDEDLYVTNWGANTLLRNDGGGRFTDVTAAAGVGDPGWGTSAAFADLDADGDLDLFIANYVDWSPATEMECLNPQGLPDYCLPLSYEAPSRDTLYRNNGDGTFTDVSEEAGLGGSIGYGLGVVCTDFDGDGAMDVFVANDSVFNHLWINQGALVFEDEALFRGCAVDEDGVAKAGMGVMAVDYDNDGDQDLFVANLERQSDSFYRNEDGIFYDRTAAIGLGFRSRAFTRFGLGFQDFDQDGWLDLYLANGRVTLPSEPGEGDPYAEVNLLFRGSRDGTMTEVLPVGGTREPEAYTSRGVAFGDLDGDGAVDLVVANRDGPVQVLRNVTVQRGNAVVIRVEETSGRSALGARLVARVGDRIITHVVQSGYSFQAASDSRIYLGLGEARNAESVSVVWVDGREELFGTLPANTMQTLRRGEGI